MVSVMLTAQAAMKPSPGSACLSLPPTCSERDSHYPHCTSEEAEAQRGGMKPCAGSRSAWPQPPHDPRGPLHLTGAQKVPTELALYLQEAK